MKQVQPVAYKYKESSPETGEFVFAEQAEQEPVDHIGIKHDVQLVETFLRCPMTGNQLYFASEPIQKKGMNFMRLQDSEGNDWTLIARLDEGWDGK